MATPAPAKAKRRREGTLSIFTRLMPGTAGYSGMLRTGLRNRIRLRQKLRAHNSVDLGDSERRWRRALDREFLTTTAAGSVAGWAAAIIAGMLMIGVLAWLPSATQRWDSALHPVLDGATFRAIGMIGFALLFGGIGRVVGSWGSLFEDSDSISLHMIPIFAAAALAVTASAYLATRTLPPVVGHLLHAIGWTSLAMFLILAASGLASLMFFAGLQRLNSRGVPEERIYALLFHAARDSQFASRWASLKWRRQWSVALNRAASLLERELFARLRTGDPASDQYLRTTLAARAAAMRRLSLRVLTADRNDGMQINAEIDGMALRVSRLDWDGLPRAAPGTVSAAGQFRVWVGEAARSLASAAAGIAALVAMKRNWIQLEGNMQGWARTGLALWVALALVSVLDPGLRRTNQLVGTWRTLVGKGGGDK